jgi:rhodanese-related sulfurtransferase
MKVVYWNEVGSNQNGPMLIDVRSAEEFAAGHIPNAVNISVDDLRSRIQEVPFEKDVVVYCAVGQRGYLAQQILRQNGFEKVWNLSGGYTTWKHAQAETELAQTEKQIARLQPA